MDGKVVSVKSGDSERHQIAALMVEKPVEGKKNLIIFSPRPSQRPYLDGIYRFSTDQRLQSIRHELTSDSLVFPYQKFTNRRRKHAFLGRNNLAASKLARICSAMC